MAQDIYQRFKAQGRLSAEELCELVPGASVDMAPVEEEAQLARVLASAAGCDYEDLASAEVSEQALETVPPRLVRRLRCLPLRVEGDLLVVATADPLDVMALDRVSRVAGSGLRIVCASQEQVNRLIEKHFGSDEQVAVEEFIQQSRRDVQARQGVRQKPRLFFAEFEDDLGSPPVEQLLEAIVSHAFRKRATDVHLSCHPVSVKLSYRVDGVLREAFEIPREIHASLLSRVKLSAGMDITTHRLPQEGNFEIAVGDQRVQVRASVFPTIQGEDVALRLQQKAMYRADMSGLGFAPDVLDAFQRMLDSPKGMILVTGPVGVGKTTTLYSALARMSGQRRKIVSLEDPVESRLDHVAQSQVSPEQGYDFARGLRSILRMDPDVIMVGEVRDPETALMALRASLTGMLVLSTLHTDRAAGAIPRLLDMDVEPYLLTSSLLGVMSQALLRTICEECKRPAGPDSRALATGAFPGDAADQRYWRGAGCDRCDQTGYFGRTGIFELLAVDDDVRDCVKRRADLPEIYAAARKGGMVTMVEDGYAKAVQGITTLEEVLRVARP